MSANMSVVPQEMQKAQLQYKFSPGVLSGQLLVISGQVGWNEHGEVVAEPEAQYTTAFENLGKVLHTAGASFADVVELDSFHTRFDDFDLFMSVKARYFSEEPHPAWTALGVASLPVPGAIAEVKATAVLPSR
jgi:enamine deaminase RidA (YjgF/YER057c/UK114 family)